MRTAPRGAGVARPAARGAREDAVGGRRCEDTKTGAFRELTMATADALPRFVGSFVSGRFWETPLRARLKSPMLLKRVHGWSG